MPFSTTYHLLGTLSHTVYLLLIGTPDNALSTSILLWLLRIITFSLLLRTYLGPWLLAQMSDHIRVRSISLWSIRGLYIRKGSRTWRVERVSYAWASVQGSRRFALKLDGLNVHIAQEEGGQSFAKTQRRSNRNLTLADLNPSPLAGYLWKFTSALTTFLEPYLRPMIRTYVVACLRIGIQWLPRITQALSFDLQSTVITLADMPGTKIVAHEISLHTALSLTQLEQTVGPEDVKPTHNRSHNRKSLSMGLWKKRLAEGFHRSLDKAWGETRGTATLSLTIGNIVGTMPTLSLQESQNVPFLLLPGSIDLLVSAKFNPKEGVVDRHGLEVSLKIGDCSVKVDLLKLLLEKLPKRPKTSIINPSEPLSPVSIQADTPLASSFSPGPQSSAAFPSPVQSFTSAIFSPSSLLFSPSSILSSSTLKSPSLLSPNLPQPFSPTSPFFKALSASIRPRRRYLVQPCVKLKDVKNVSQLSILHSIRVNVASIGLSVLTEAETGPYKALIKGVAVDFSLSDPDTNRLHREHLGCRSKRDTHDPDAYSLKLNLHQITVERETQHHTMRLARLDSFVLIALASQWPSPFLVPGPFMGDANSPILAVWIRVAGVQITERIQDLQKLIAIIGATQKTHDEHHMPSTSLSIPRLIIGLESGPIGVRIIYDADKGEKHRALELRNNGFSVSLNSEYKHPSLAIARTFPWASSVQSLHWSCTLSIVLEPVLVRVRLKQKNIAVEGEALLTSDNDFLDDPPILSVGTIEVNAAANAVAQTDGAAESLAVIDKSTLVYELSAAFDTICIELWHPISVDATLRLLSIIPHKTKMPEATFEAQPRFARLPAGLSAKIAVAHFVVYITSPVISPGENLELSRGFAMRTTISLEYCSLHASHDHWFNDPKQTQSRAKLLLPAEASVEALVTAKTTVTPGEKSAFLKIRVVNLVFRTAVATPYEPDEPAIVGRDDLTDGHQDFLRIGHMHFNLCLSCKLLSPHRKLTDICNVSVQIPSIRADLELSHAYSVLLGLQTFRILSPPQPASRPVESKGNIVFVLQGNITTIRVHLALPNQTLVTRIDGLSPRLDSSGPPRIRMAKTAVFVSLPSQINRWEEPTESRWDEFVTLLAWEVCLAPHAGSLSISINGDSARLRIPYGFVLADLVQDVVVSLKAVRHISHMASAGCYSAMPSPEPEGPKSVPHITLRLACLCLEAQDDPFESKLALIWQAGAEAVKQRLDREDAFKAKVATILAATPDLQNAIPKAEGEHEYQFSAKHTVPIEDARKRLDDVHALDWALRLERLKEQRSKEEDAIRHKTHSHPPTSSRSPDLTPIPSLPQAPPLLRATLHNLSLTISPPSFSIERLPDVMHDFGGGLPRDTKFSLLVPLHIHFTLSSLKVSLRDYPLPLFNVPLRGTSRQVSWTFNTDLIVGEEMGSELSVDWIDCPVIRPQQALHGEAPFSIAVPKTIMPVKTYAAPTIEITTAGPTILSWAVSYGPAIQDMMRVVETLSSSPRDSSPAMGFWDKMRLIFHWTVKISFVGDVRLYIKGTRDPYNTLDSGAGFVLCWQGSPEIRVGNENPQKELIQVISEGMLIAVPNLEHFAAKGCSTSGSIVLRQKKPFQKVCARLSSGVRFGVGFVVERSCGPECLQCDGTAFHRKCRHFSFLPHYNVILEKKLSIPDIKGPNDSYNGFRSDFIHLSVSLTSSTKIKEFKGSAKPSSLHLTPRLFAHFWSWCSLFDGALSLPVRQGSYHPSRPISPKLGRHLATLKYRISLSNLYLVHGYMNNSRETWVDGVTPWVGVKGRVEEFQADMHQREEESTAAGPIPDTTRVVRRKPFYAAEVTMKGIELRAMLATFSEPLKQDVQITASAERSNYRKHTDLPVTTSTSTWYDLEDFVELAWLSSSPPVLHLLPLATLPHFTYFKRNSSLPGVFPQTSKFGSEHSHICLLGKEPSVPQTQISLASARATELKKSLQSEATPRSQKGLTPSSRSSVKKMLALLEEYITALRDTELRLDDPPTKEPQNYHMPTDIVSPDEWAEFDNVYQIHCPSVFMDRAVRDIMVQYYYCSRERRGFEYHMANRAVKFIRDQANAALAVQKEEERVKERGPGNTAQMAATALRKTYAILKGDNSTKISVDLAPERSAQVPGKIEPLDGWAEGVSLQKSDCCLLLKPQIVLRGETPADSCIVAAAQAKLQSFAIMDDFNLDDPVNGKVMSRNYTSISGLQAFAPTNLSAASDGPIPLEVLIDLRCESEAFERLVPQTDATFHYDKFNRLRLRNNITSTTTKSSNQNSATENNSHLQDQTDVIRVHIPRFTVSANAEHFQAISNIVTKLLLFSDPAHKTRLDKLETLVFTYDFTDLGSAASVVSNLQSRLRDALETERLSMKNPRRLEDEESRLSLLHLRAHMFLLAEELNLLFDAIKMAQDRSTHQTDQNSALLLHASSSEISWRMLDERRNLLSKLVVTNINFHWLSRQDSSTVNHLTIGNLTAFDGSRYALWAEILSKYDEPANHPLLKRGLFLLANWTILAPVGGITIYEAFELSLHPLRLQIDSKVGRRIMEYVWPDRKDRQAALNDTPSKERAKKPAPEIEIKSPTSGRSSIDSPRALHRPVDSGGKALIPPLRKLGSSRSFTDLRLAKDTGFPSPLNTTTLLSPPGFLQRTHSSDSINFAILLDAETQRPNAGLDPDVSDPKSKDAGDAQVMKTRSSQKSFVLVHISSLHLLLSVAKEGSFECHDARIKTRELEYRNQTWSFEELVNQFIPSNMSWRGWVKMALNQPLVPVLPVARELLSKTKWTASKSGSQPHDHPLRLLHPSILAVDDDSRLDWIHGGTLKTIGGSSKHDPLKTKKDSPIFTETPLTAEPESMNLGHQTPIQSSDPRPTGRKRVKSLFSKSSRHSSKGKTVKRQSEDVKGGSN
ncbi:hypothetical protein BYT27DRAFT_7182979 [Phlegmacium glaucopus]|nr:hypothetical protein BYT27DRAFT_7182979 [Phlegmacium glaucopus]